MVVPFGIAGTIGQSDQGTSSHVPIRWKFGSRANDLSGKPLLQKVADRGTWRRPVRATSMCRGVSAIHKGSSAIRRQNLSGHEV